MISKIKAKLSNNATLYLLASLIYSFSTYIVVLLIPYKLNLALMADFSAALNIIMMLSFVFEFGVVTSYLRYNQLYAPTRYINAYIQLAIFIFILFVSQTFLGDALDHFLGMDNVDLNQNYLYMAVFAILSWVFFKNIFLANKNIMMILINAVILTALRIAMLGYILWSDASFSTDEIYLYLFILPFAFIIFFNLKHDFSEFKSSLTFAKDAKQRALFFKRAKQILIFAFTTYMITIIFVYTSRYAVIYLTKMNATQLIADLGYATSFGGLIVIFSVSLRSFFISKFNISNPDEIDRYITKMASFKVKFLIASIMISGIIALLVYLIKPDYLSMDAVIFVFLLVEAYLLSAYLGMFSLLSKTFNFNNLELKLNILRFILVFGFTHLLLLKYPIAGFSAINLSMVLVELYFAKIVLGKVAEKRSA